MLKGAIVKYIQPRTNENKIDLHIENNHDSKITVQIITVDADTFRLASNPRIRQSANKLTKPLDRPGIDRVEIGEGAGVAETITKEDRPSFYPVSIEPEQPVLTPNQTSTRVVDLEVVSPVFKPNNKWRLTDGNATYNVKMEDQDFLAKVRNHQVTFGSGDILKVLLQQNTQRTSDGLKTSYTVLEVIENVTPPKLPY